MKDYFLRGDGKDIIKTNTDTLSIYKGIMAKASIILQTSPVIYK